MGLMRVQSRAGAVGGQCPPISGRNRWAWPTVSSARGEGGTGVVPWVDPRPRRPWMDQSPEHGGGSTKGRLCLSKPGRRG